MGLSPTTGSKAPGAFPEDGIWGQRKVVGTETPPTALLFWCEASRQSRQQSLRLTALLCEPLPYAPDNYYVEPPTTRPPLNLCDQ